MVILNEIKSLTPLVTFADNFQPPPAPHSFPFCPAAGQADKKAWMFPPSSGANKTLKPHKLQST